MEPQDNDFHGKLLSYEEAPSFLENARSEGKKIAHCHGTFDLIHPGHVYHLEEAKSLGDILVVTLTGEKYVNKGPGRPYFNDHLRVKALAALECVDYVVVIPFPAAVEAIECVRPDIYCKGKEYENTANDPTGNILDDVHTVEKLGGKVEYIGTVVFSSTKLLNRHFDAQRSTVKNFCERLSRKFPPDRIKKEVERFQELSVLVIGDIIFDRYSQVVVQGLTSKNKTISARHLDSETQPGGSLAVYRHLKEFTPNVKLIGLVGAEPWVDGRLGDYLDSDSDRVIRNEAFTTVIKHRFVEIEGHDKEVGKLFSVNFLDDYPPDNTAQEEVLKNIGEEIENADVTIVMDFGHGLMQGVHRRFVEENARMMVLNCQTNSFNHGFNIINRQYRRADVVTVDTAELCLARSERHFDARGGLAELVEFLGAQYGFFTQGDSPTLGAWNDQIVDCPAFESVVTDTVGAGDAFCSLAALATANGLPVEVATFLGQVAGAQAVKIVGNRECIDKGAFVKAATTLLNY